MILFIDSTVREHSRTRRLAERLVSRLDIVGADVEAILRAAEAEIDKVRP